MLIQVITRNTGMIRLIAYTHKGGSTVNLWREFFTDPVIFFSFTGLAVVLAICIFYAIYFVVKVKEA